MEAPCPYRLSQGSIRSLIRIATGHISPIHKCNINISSSNNNKVGHNLGNSADLEVEEVHCLIAGEAQLLQVVPSRNPTVALALALAQVEEGCPGPTRGELLALALARVEEGCPGRTRGELALALPRVDEGCPGPIRGEAQVEEGVLGRTIEVGVAGEWEVVQARTKDEEACKGGEVVLMPLLAKDQICLRRNQW